MADSEGAEEPYHGNNHELGSRLPGQPEKRHLKADDDEDVQDVGGVTGGGHRGEERHGYSEDLAGRNHESHRQAGADQCFQSDADERTPIEPAGRRHDVPEVGCVERVDGCCGTCPHAQPHETSPELDPLKPVVAEGQDPEREEAQVLSQVRRRSGQHKEQRYPVINREPPPHDPRDQDQGGGERGVRAGRAPPE